MLSVAPRTFAASLSAAARPSILPSLCVWTSAYSSPLGRRTAPDRVYRRRRVVALLFVLVIPVLIALYRARVGHLAGSGDFNVVFVGAGNIMFGECRSIVINEILSSADLSTSLLRHGGYPHDVGILCITVQDWCMAKCMSPTPVPFLCHISAIGPLSPMNDC